MSSALVTTTKFILLFTKSDLKKCLLLSALQASEGVPIRFFTMLPELVEAYYSPNMGLVTHLQYSVQWEEEVEEEPGQKLHFVSILVLIWMRKYCLS